MLIGVLRHLLDFEISLSYFFNLYALSIKFISADTILKGRAIVFHCLEYQLKKKKKEKKCTQLKDK